MRLAEKLDWKGLRPVKTVKKLQLELKKGSHLCLPSDHQMILPLESLVLLQISASQVVGPDLI